MSGPMVKAGDYPALREFLRGYFHQDMKEEYGSAAGAARAFCDDADVTQRAAVAGEWVRLLEAMKGQSVEVLNEILIGELGSSFSVTEDEVKKISGVLGPAPGKSKA